MQILIFTALITAVLALTLKKSPDISMMVSLAGGTVIMLKILPQLTSLISAITEMAEQGGISGNYILIILKAVGVAIAVTICASVCRDAGQSSLAVKVEIAGRVIILITSLPVLSGLFGIISDAMR